MTKDQSRSVLTDLCGEIRDRRRQQVWLDRLRDVHLVAHCERAPHILGAGVRGQRQRQDESATLRLALKRLSHPMCQS